jgi:hypothetical protein
MGCYNQPLRHRPTQRKFGLLQEALGWWSFSSNVELQPEQLAVVLARGSE